MGDRRAVPSRYATVLLSIVLVIGLCPTTSSINPKLRKISISQDLGESSSNDTQLTIHLIPHTHDDVGWIKTVNGYYETEVTKILESVTNFLSNSSRGHGQFNNATESDSYRFHWAETVWLSKWVSEDRESRVAALQVLLDNGQLEFIGGGWVQNDETVTHWIDVVRQMTEGHLFLQNTFGDKYLPKIGWQIDPFGASRVTPYLFQEMGFQHHVIDRIPDNVQVEFVKQGSMEFVWSPTQMFTHVLDMLYESPVDCDWEGIEIGVLPSAPITDENLVPRADVLVAQLKLRAVQWRTPHVLIPFGGDFHYQNASLQFLNMDKLVNYINSNSARYGMKIQYSFLSEYFQAVYPVHENGTASTTSKHQMKQSRGPSDVSFPNLEPTNLLPYRMFTNWWSGFYSSRPLLKVQSRALSSLLNAAESVYAIAAVSGDVTLSDDMYNTLVYAREVTSVLQHHDAITGTSRALVVENYSQMVLNASTAVTALTCALLLDLAGVTQMTAPARPPIDTATSFVAVAYNPLSSSLYGHRIVRIPLPAISSQSCGMLACHFTDGSGSDVPCQVDGDHAIAIVQVPPLGWTALNVSATAASSSHCERGSRHPESVSQLKNGILDVTLDTGTSLVQSVTKTSSGSAPQSVAINQMFARYESTFGNAYEMGDLRGPVPVTSGQGEGRRSPTRRGATGDVVQSVSQRVSSDVAQTVSIYSDSTSTTATQTTASVVELNVTAGVLDENVELVMQLNTNLTDRSQSAILIRDANGLFLESHAFDEKRGRAGNYLPATQFAAVYSDDTYVALCFGHPHAVTSYKSGLLEVVLHRRMSHDNPALGLEQALNDTTIVSDVMWLIVGQRANMEADLFYYSQILNNPVRIAAGGVVSAPVPRPSGSLLGTENLPFDIAIPALHILRNASARYTDKRDGMDVKSNGYRHVRRGSKVAIREHDSTVLAVSTTSLVVRLANYASTSSPAVLNMFSLFNQQLAKLLNVPRIQARSLSLVLPHTDADARFNRTSGDVTMDRSKVRTFMLPVGSPKVKHL